MRKGERERGKGEDRSNRVGWQEANGSVTESNGVKGIHRGRDFEFVSLENRDYRSLIALIRLL